MRALVRLVGVAVLAWIAGALVGAFTAAAYNHLECSSVAQVLQGCKTLKPSGVGRVVGFLTAAGAVIAIVAAGRGRRDRP